MHSCVDVHVIIRRQVNRFGTKQHDSSCIAAPVGTVEKSHQEHGTTRTVLFGCAICSTRQLTRASLARTYPQSQKHRWLPSRRAQPCGRRRAWSLGPWRPHLGFRWGYRATRSRGSSFHSSCWIQHRCHQYALETGGGSLRGRWWVRGGWPRHRTRHDALQRGGRGATTRPVSCVREC